MIPVFLAVPRLAMAAAPAAPSVDDVASIYRALEATDRSGATAVSFAALWADAAAHQGRLVRLEGVARRRFRQDAVGAFPPLTELWITDDHGNPSCLVHPSASPGPPLGTRVRFEGTFLRMIRYASADGDRLAPLVVGPSLPEAIEAGARSVRGWPSNRADWVVGGLLVALVVVVLVAQHLKRPRRRPTWTAPDPKFVRPGEAEPSRPQDEEPRNVGGS